MTRLLLVALCSMIITILSSYQNNWVAQPRFLRRSGFWSEAQIPYFPSWGGLG
ncbi:MAG: hypothetical protein F6K24_31585 [Okeania sp. SIO2D1]|nr:hypothetical protein [Okeania sp. SIO2D1]